MLIFIYYYAFGLYLCLNLQRPSYTYWQFLPNLQFFILVFVRDEEDDDDDDDDDVGDGGGGDDDDEYYYYSF